jgi:hypothetical protein
MKGIQGNINRDRYKVLERFIAKYLNQCTMQMENTIKRLWQN